MRLNNLSMAFLIAILTMTASLAQAEGKPAIDGVGRVDHVFVIVLENHSRNSLIDYAAIANQCRNDGDTSYFTALACKYASAAKYYGVTHPSLPNYVAMISGSTWSITSDKLESFPPLNHPTLVDQLEAAHKTWAGYMEALPDGEGNKLINFWPENPGEQLYASKHNPFILFKSIRDNRARLAHIKPYAEMTTDLTSEKTTPNFAFIVPDQCDDMHGGVNTFVPGHDETPCPYHDETGLRQNAAAFVQRALAKIIHSKAWKSSKSVIFIIADESDYNARTEHNGMYSGGLVPAIVIVSKGGKQGGYVSSVPHNHYSLLATVENIWHLGLLGHASDTEHVKPMTEFLTK